VSLSKELDWVSITTGRDFRQAQRRGYSPKVGRFLSPDTIIPGYVNSQNLYSDSLKHGLCQRLQSSQIIQIQPLQHDALKPSFSKLVQLLPDLARITHDCPPPA